MKDDDNEGVQVDNECIQKYQNVKHVFIDELNSYKSVQTVIKQFKQPLEYLWIVPSKDFGIEEDLNKELPNFDQLTLEINLRNSKEITKYACEGSKSEVSCREDHSKILAMNPENYPNGKEVVRTTNLNREWNDEIIIEACKKMREKIGNKSFILLLRKFSLEVVIPEKKRYEWYDPKTVTSIKDDLQKNDENVEFYTNNLRHIDMSMKGNAVAFLRGEDKTQNRILITDITSMQGFDWPGIVFVNPLLPTTFSAESSTVNCYLRAVTDLYEVNPYPSLFFNSSIVGQKIDKRDVY